MNTKSKLRDYLRRAQSDAAFRKELLENACFMKKTSGWLSLISVLILAGTIFATRSWFALQSASTWGNLMLAAMMYDKYSDRVAMLESMEEPSPCFESNLVNRDAPT